MVGGETKGSLTERGSHLGNIVHIFYRRRATWKDFGDFLLALTTGSLHKEGMFLDQACRHGPQTGLQGDYFERVRQGKAKVHECLIGTPVLEACRSFGKGEDNKTPGMIVQDICTLARKFCEGRGLEIVKRNIVNDEDFNQEEELSNLLPIINDHIPTGQGDLDIQLGDVPNADDTSDYGSFDIALSDLEDFEDDNLQDLDIGRPNSSDQDIPMSGVPELQSSQASLGAVPKGTKAKGPRKTTKIRVATLAYLANYAHDPAELRRQYHILRDNKKLNVLHLCGCGIKNSSGYTVAGCSTPSHLILGTQSLNLEHGTYHDMVNGENVHDYLVMTRCIHKRPGCEGLF
jgi:hypothetical protein